MKPIMQIFLREIRLITGESSLLLTVLLAPIIYAFIYGSIYINKDEHDVRLAVVDADRSALSRLMIREINSSGAIEAVEFPGIPEAKEAMYRGDVQGYLEIENGLGSRIYAQKQSNINLYISSAQFLPSSAVMATMNEVALTLGAGIRRNYFEKNGAGSREAMQMTNPVVFDYRPLFNTGRNYGTFLIPGLLAIILQQTLLIGLCAAVAEDREKGTLQTLLATRRPSEVIIGKGLIYWLIFIVYGIFFVTVNFSVLGAEFRGSYSHLFILTGVFLAAIITMAMLAGSFFKNTAIAFQVMGFSSYPIFMITGYSLPRQALPDLIRWISDCIPTTPFLQAYSSVVNAGGTLNDNLRHLLHLTALWLFFSILLVLRLRFLKRCLGRQRNHPAENIAEQSA